MSALILTWFDEDDPLAWRRWMLAAGLVLAAHLGLVGGYLLLRPPPDLIGDDSPIVSLELAPIDSVADAQRRDVAPAPEEMVEQKATPPAPDKPPQKTQVEQPPPPEEAPSEIAVQEQKPPAKVEPQQPPAPMTAAPVKGGAPKVEPSWESRLVRKLQQYKRYPGEAQARGEQGVVVATFSIDRNGRVLSRSIAKSSGHPALDSEVLAMIERAQPLPPFPPSMTEPQISLTVPIRFSLR